LLRDTGLKSLLKICKTHNIDDRDKSAKAEGDDEYDFLFPRQPHAS
jgi:hypothetical protein